MGNTVTASGPRPPLRRAEIQRTAENVPSWPDMKYVKSRGAWLCSPPQHDCRAWLPARLVWISGFSKEIGNIRPAFAKTRAAHGFQLGLFGSADFPKRS